MSLRKPVLLLIILLLAGMAAMLWPRPAPGAAATVAHRAIATGYEHSCALLSDGSVRCWGDNFYGQLGDNTTTDRTTPVAVSGLTNAVAIAAGGNFTCALLSDGSVRCWGDNAGGEVGDGTTTERHMPVAVCDVGATPPCTTGNANILSNAIAITVGSQHACALLSDGGVRCWGANGVGELGDGTTTNRSTPVPVCDVGATAPCTTGNANILSNAIAITAGGDHTCALLGDGSARCWGYNINGQLGDNTTTVRTTPVAVSGLTNAVAIAAGLLHTCALLSDGSARCWGYNGYGQLGDNTTTDRHTPVAVSGLSNAVAIATSGYGYHTCALLSDGSARCWGNNANGQLGDNTTTDRLIPVAVSGLSNAVAIATGGGGGHSCALRSDGSARCWGDNPNGQLGDGTTTDRLTPVTVSGLQDTDRDGCTDTRETQTAPGSQVSGGQRNPKNFWDFFDVWTHPSGMPAVWERTKTVNLNEIFAIANRFAAVGGTSGDPLIQPVDDTSYHTAYDRTLVGPDPWDLGPPSGAIGLTDINLAAAQFAHNCV